jgi:hypothetical protein
MSEPCGGLPSELKKFSSQPLTRRMTSGTLDFLFRQAISLMNRRGMSGAAGLDSAILAASPASLGRNTRHRPVSRSRIIR